MSKSREYMSLYPENPPEWYWISGLHDAGIVGVESFEFPFELHMGQYFLHRKLSRTNLRYKGYKLRVLCHQF